MTEAARVEKRRAREIAHGRTRIILVKLDRATRRLLAFGNISAEYVNNSLLG